MANSVNDFWNRILNSFQVENHGYYTINELYKVPSKPGIYAWYVKFEQQNEQEYYKIFKQKKVGVDIKGNLKEHYEGEARNKYVDNTYSIQNMDYSLCELASYVFCPPLYIGISKDLNERLNTHAKELEKIYIGGKILPTPSLGKTDFDTIVESAHFAERLGYSLKSFPTVDLNAIYVKTIEMPAQYTWTELQKVEKYLNRTYTPIYGRK